MHVFTTLHLYFEPLEGTNFSFIFTSSCHIENITKKL